MINNINSSSGTNILTDMSKNENMSVEKEQTKTQNRIEELKQMVMNDQYKIDLKATATKMAQELRPF